MTIKFNNQNLPWLNWARTKLSNAVLGWKKKIYLPPATRRFFVSLFFIVSLISVPLLHSFTPVVAQQARAEIRGVWMTNNDFNILRDRTKVQEAVTKLRQMNFNTIYPVVWNSGYAMYPSAVAQKAEIQTFVYKGTEGHDILADITNQGHQQGLLVIPWFEFGFMTPPTSELATNHPEWLTRKRDGSNTSISAGGEVVWLNPFHPEVQEFISSLVLEVMTQYDVDGIQFDDHTSLPYEFGYDPYTVALYTQETGNRPPNNPQDQKWMRWRADKITTFMVNLNQEVKARKPNAIFSVSPNYYDFAYKFHLQDWLSWVRLNIVDELIVQVYNPNFQSFTNTISRPEMQEAQKTIPTGVGIMAGLRNSPVPMQQIQSQVRAVKERGLGLAFFYYESLWNSTSESANDRESAFEAFFPNPAFRYANRQQ